MGSSRRTVPEANRLSTCALCRRTFAVCGPCDRGRRYCGPDCAHAARRTQLRRAGRQYQCTEHGRAAHATRQARYRARLARVTHHSADRRRPLLDVERRRLREPGWSRRAVFVRLREHLVEREPSRVTPSSCVKCGTCSGFLRSGFRGRRTSSSVAKLASCPLSGAPETAPLRARPPEQLLRAGPSELHAIPLRAADASQHVQETVPPETFFTGTTCVLHRLAGVLHR